MLQKKLTPLIGGAVFLAKLPIYQARNITAITYE